MQTVSHTYANGSTTPYIIRVTAVSGSNEYSAKQLSVRIYSRSEFEPATINATPVVNLHKNYDANAFGFAIVATFTDTSPSDVGSYAATIAFSGAFQDLPGTISYANGVFSIGVEVPYVSSGTYEMSVSIAKLTLTGFVTQAIVTVPVTIRVVPPTPLITSISPDRFEGSLVSVTGRASYPGSSASPAGVALSWVVFKDGSTNAYDAGSGDVWSFTPNDNGSYRIVLTAIGESDLQVSVSETIDITNVAPVLSNLVATTISENGVTTLTGKITDPSKLDSFTLNVNWGDSLSPNNVEAYTFPAGTTTFTLSHQYLDDNPTNSKSDIYTIGLTITDDDTGTTTTSTTVTINNVAPVVNSVVSSAGTLDTRSTNGIVSINGVFRDVGTLDTHVVMVDWGDGSSSTAVTVNPLTRTFAGLRTYATGGLFTIIAIDDDGGVSAPEKATAYVEGVGLVGRVLYVIGTDGKDDVDVKLSSGSNSGKLEVKAKLSKGKDSVEYNSSYNAASVDRIFMFVAGDDDKVKIDKDVMVDSTLYGGAGNDKLDGGGGRDFIFGEAGDDNLSGGRGSDVVVGGDGNDNVRGGSDSGLDTEFDGRDILIGGMGEDEIKADKGDDLLVGGFTDYDNNVVVLDLIHREWTSDRPYDSRVENLRAGSGNVLKDSGVMLKASGSGKTVFDDNAQDELKGGSGRDWYFADYGALEKKRDKTSGRDGNEIIDLVY